MSTIKNEKDQKKVEDPINVDQIELREKKSKSRSRKPRGSKTTSQTKNSVAPRVPPKDTDRRNNIIIVRQSLRFKTLVIKVKNILKNQFDSVELHAVDDQSFLTISLVTQCLMKYKYVTMARLKTKTVQTRTDIGNNFAGKDADDYDADPRIILQPKLVVHLKKTPEFDTIYDDFEAIYKKVAEEHKDEIEIHDANVKEDPPAE